MSIPASYQENAPFGSNTGGVSPQFTAIIATAAYDGWLTVGITEGDGAGALGNIGIDWDGWTADAGIENNNCAVFWLSPDDSPAGSAVVAQFTVAGDWSASFGAQGRSSEGGGNDWSADNIAVSSSGGGGGDTGGGDPPPPPPADVDCAESGNTAADCLDSCAVAAATVTTGQSGSGAACVGDYTCVAGDGACPADVADAQGGSATPSVTEIDTSTALGVTTYRCPILPATNRHTHLAALEVGQIWCPCWQSI